MIRNVMRRVVEALRPEGDGWSAPDRKYRPLIERYAGLLEVSGAIHRDDHIFNFVVEHPMTDDLDRKIRYYFEDGRDSALRFGEIVHAHLPQRPLAQVRVLEFASGYGCVSRHLAGACDLTCCDIHPAAQDFVANALGLETVLSTSVPEALELPGRYDVVFALSFFSHMPLATWRRWLARLAEAVEPGGLLVFTTQGEASRVHFGNPEIPASGFWFRPTSEQKDLPVEEYGQTIVTESFVRESIDALDGVDLLEVRPACWWAHQDLYVLRRSIGEAQA